MTDLLVKNCKYKFGLPQKTQTIINVLKSTHIQILTAINSLESNYPTIAKVGPGSRDAPPAHQLNVSAPLIFIKPYNVFNLLSQLTRLKVVPHPAIPQPVKLCSGIGTVYRQLQTI